MLNILDKSTHFVISALVILGSAFALYTGATGPFEAPVQRGFFVLVMLPLVFLMTPSKLIRNKTMETSFNLVLAAATIGVMSWNLYDFERLYSEPFIEIEDIII